MADNEPSVLPPVSPEHRRVAAGQYERAQQVIAKGDYDYGIPLLITCCKLDPANLIYRKFLRQTEKSKYKNNLRGSRLAVLTTSPTKAKIKGAKHNHDYLKVLELGEDVLTKNPWDTGVQMDMAEAADALGLLDLSVWLLEHARQKDPKDAAVNRSLALMYEKRGNFTQAIKLWEMVVAADPSDLEARNKSKDLAASETISRGNYDNSGTGKPGSKAAIDLPPLSGKPGSKASIELPPVGGKPASKASIELPASGNKSKQGSSPNIQIEPAGRPAATDRVSREAESLRNRIDADPTNANTYLHLASVYRRADQFDQATKVLQEGLGPTGNHFELIVELADLETERFRRDLALTEDKLRKQPDAADLRKIRDQLVNEINARELEIYRKKADRYPNEKTHRFELGVRLLRARQFDEAIQELQALKSEPRFQWRALMYLGFCFKLRNNWRLAQRNFEESLKIMPTTETEPRKEMMFELAQGLVNAGELAKGIDMASDLANLDFGYRSIGTLLDEWQTRLQES